MEASTSRQAPQRPSKAILGGPVTRLQKRRQAEPADEPEPKQGKLEVLASPRKTTRMDLSLFVRWYSPTGKTKVNHLQLKTIGNIEALEGISKNLVQRAFPENDRPDYLTSDDFYRFTPTEEFMSLPGDIARTEFRLVAAHEGWEYTILERELGAHRDPERKMLVTVIEFESTALMIGQLGVRVSLISYPVVSIKKTFLDGIEEQLKRDANFKGIL